jgi:hypothetical protein
LHQAYINNLCGYCCEESEGSNEDYMKDITGTVILVDSESELD